MALWRAFSPKRSDVIVRVSRETLLFTRNTTVVQSMELLHASWNQHCEGKFDTLLQKPMWPGEGEDEIGKAMHGTVYAFDVPIFWLAMCVFLFSIVFQFWRFTNSESFQCTFCGRSFHRQDPLYKPEKGPDFSRWLEYFCTSPLQILIVSTSFGFATVDALLGQCGMQAALVLLGYDIEQQIKKVYKRKLLQSPKQPRRFHNALYPFIKDLRIFVYLGFSWLLHFGIWGLPYPGHGIGGKYAQLQQQLEKCVPSSIGY